MNKDCKNPQQNFCQPDTIANLKDHLAQSSRIHPSDARLKSDTPHQQNEGQKPHHYLN